MVHTYLVCTLGVTMTGACFALARGAARASPRYRMILVTTGIIWVVSAPVFFLLPTDIDGVYERYLGAVSFVLILTLAHLFHKRSKQREAN